MNEFIEKLIKRLEEETYNMEICEEQFDMNSPYFMDVEYKMVKFDDAKTIINELAEEYSADTSQKSANGWIPCSERLPEEQEKGIKKGVMTYSRKKNVCKNHSIIGCISRYAIIGKMFVFYTWNVCR